MLLIDDVLLFPVHGILWIFREIYEAAEQEVGAEKDNIKARLSELYMMLETGQITEAEFDAQEKQLLERFEELEKRETYLESDEEPLPDDAED